MSRIVEPFVSPNRKTDTEHYVVLTNPQAQPSIVSALLLRSPNVHRLRHALDPLCPSLVVRVHVSPDHARLARQARGNGIPIDSAQFKKFNGLSYGQYSIFEIAIVFHGTRLLWLRGVCTNFVVGERPSETTENGVLSCHAPRSRDPRSLRLSP